MTALQILAQLAKMTSSTALLISNLIFQLMRPTHVIYRWVSAKQQFIHQGLKQVGDSALVSVTGMNLSTGLKETNMHTVNKGQLTAFWKIHTKQGNLVKVVGARQLEKEQSQLNDPQPTVSTPEKSRPDPSRQNGPAAAKTWKDLPMQDRKPIAREWFILLNAVKIFAQATPVTDKQKHDLIQQFRSFQKTLNAQHLTLGKGELAFEVQKLMHFATREDAPDNFVQGLAKHVGGLATQIEASNRSSLGKNNQPSTTLGIAEKVVPLAAIQKIDVLERSRDYYRQLGSFGPVTGAR